MVNDLLLVLKANLGIRDERRKKNGMGLPAFPTPDALDAEDEHSPAALYAPVVETVEDERSGRPAGTLHPVKGEGKDDIIIILGKLETVRINLYHGHV